MDTWDVGWEELGATSRASYQQECEDGWRELEPALEQRELQQATDACERVVEETPDLSCEELGAIILD